MTDSYGHVFQERAQYEFDDATDWYRDRSKLASENFAKEVFQSIDLICKTPHRWPVSDAGFHEFVLKKFPYSVVYRIDEMRKLVLIISVFHHKRHPKQKLKP
ncbi:MAG: hypothetical protein GC178_08910 [Flavobacteriales bacterium]|nr:hypothetical protein [Flavobacteriales bacterium]